MENKQIAELIQEIKELKVLKAAGNKTVENIMWFIIGILIQIIFSNIRR